MLSSETIIADTVTLEDRYHHHHHHNQQGQHAPPKAPLHPHSGPDYPYGIYWPIHSATSPTHFCYLLFTSGDGMFTISLLSILGLLLYRIFGNPIQSHEEDKRRERMDLWTEHHNRFMTASGPDGMVRSTGALYYAPPSTQEEEDDDERERENDDAEQIKPVRVETVEITLSADPSDSSATNTNIHVEKTRVTIVGDRSESTLSIITHHDICCNFRHGLLPLSIDFTGDSNKDIRRRHRPKGEKKNRTDDGPAASFSNAALKFVGNLSCGTGGVRGGQEQVCFYHISAPGHIEGENSSRSEGGKSEAMWKMDALASRMNKIISCLGITGRCVYLGEGAGANVCLRAASESIRRNFGRYGTAASGSSTGTKIATSSIMVSGLALISPECSGPTLGNTLTAGIASSLLRKRIGPKSIPLGLLGTPSALLNDRQTGYMNIMDSLDMPSVAMFAQAYYSVDMRTRLRKKTKRMGALHGLPNLVLCSEESTTAKDRAAEVCEVLDPTRGSGVVAVHTSGKVMIGSRYVVGGGAVLSDWRGRRACIEAFKLFLEAL